MSKTIVLVACVSKKLVSPCPAKDLYISDWFKKASQYAIKVSRHWYVLSAKYGLLSPDRIIGPYNETLNKMPAAARRTWAVKVLKDLQTVLNPGDKVVILAGKRYREHLVTPLQSMRCLVVIPMEGLAIGKQLQWLGQRIK